MVKKLKKMAEQKAASPAGLFDSELAGAVKESAHQIWLAGMGAFAKAQDGGTKVFEGLMKEGLSLQRKTQAAAEDKLGEVAGKVTAMAEDVGAKAGQHWDKLESIFEQRTARAMSKLGVPTAKDVAALAERVDALAAAVAKLSKGSAAAPKTSAKPAAKASVKTAMKAAKPAAKVARKAAPAKRVRKAA
jgi:poly(hydroxyalkanoate) granule-associated protein